MRLHRRGHDEISFQWFLASKLVLDVVCKATYVIPPKSIDEFLVTGANIPQKRVL